MSNAWHDLSQPLSSAMAAPQYFPPPEFQVILERTDVCPQVTKFTLCTHMGTHVDAPSHFIDGGRSIDEIPLERFVVPAHFVALDGVQNQAITIDALQAAGAAPRRGEALLIGTGWDAHWHAPQYFAHPYLADDVAGWLVDAGVTLLGVDFMTPDVPVALRSPDFRFPVHRTLLGNDVLIVENLRGLRALAGRRMELHAMPLPIAAGDGAPARVAARAL